jgi:hypothetical protein
MGANVIQDNLHILINKQLSSNVLKYKQIGVIGALMMLKNMSSLNGGSKRSNKRKSGEQNDTSNLNETEEDFFSCSSTQHQPDDSSMSVGPSNSTKIDTTLNVLSSEIKHIWQMIMDSSKSSPESLGLFEDNLSSILNKNSIHSECVETLIKENLRQMTKNLFKLDMNEQHMLQKAHNDKLSSFKIGYDFGLDVQSNGALNLLSQQMSDSAQKKNLALVLLNGKGSNSLSGGNCFVSAITIASTFRLFASLERSNILSLKDYIGLPVLTIKKDELYKYGNFYDSNSVNSQMDSSFGATTIGKIKFFK